MRRRELLSLTGIGLAAAIGGCTGSDGEDGDDGSDGEDDGTETETDTDAETESENSDEDGSDEGDGSDTENDTDGENDSDSDGDGSDGDSENGPDGADGENGDENGENGDGEPAVGGPAPQTFSGSGAEVVDDVEIEDGLTVVEAAHTGGESNFIVEFVPSSGDFNTPFVNEIGAYEGETAELMDADTYQIDVDADGDWELTVRQPRAESGEGLPQSLSDETHAVFGPFEFDGNHTAAGEHAGDTNFIVRVFPPEGMFGEVVFNEINEFEGETTFNHDGVGYVAVQGYGEWSVDLE